MKKRIITIFAALTLIFSIIPFAVGCSGRREGELFIWWPGAEAEIAALHRAVELYREINPDVTFRIMPQATTDFFMSYMIATQGRNYPDIAFVDSVYVPQLANMELVTNLSQFDSEIDTLIREQIVDSLWPANLYRGSAYALPISANVLTLVYNKTLLRRVYQALGYTWTEADVPSTWDELMEVSALFIRYNELRGLTGPHALIPYTIPAGGDHRSMGAKAFVSMSARMGGSIMNDELTEMRLYSSANVEAARKIQYLGQRGFSPPVFQEGAFGMGQVGFIELGPWTIDRFQNITDERGYEFGFAPMLTLKEDGTNESSLGIFSMVSTAGGINEALAVDFMKFFLTNDEVMLLHNRGLNLMPVTESTITDPFFSEGDVWPVFMEQLNHVVARPGSSMWVAMERDIADFVTHLITGVRQPEQLIDLHIYFGRQL